MEDQGIGRKYLELINEVNNEDKDTATKSTPEVLTNNKTTASVNRQGDDM